MNVTIITGVSRGLGEALAERLLRPGHRIVGIARTENPAIASVTADSGGDFEFHAYDLKQTAGLNALMERVFGSIAPERTSSVTLINNAGMLEPMMPLDQAEESLLTDHLHVNLLAPMLLTSSMIRLTRGWTIPRTVVNISSGAGKKPYAGWSAYCTAKAGIDMLTRTVALEQGEGEHAVKLVSIAPGVVDTGMQELIRRTPPDDFPEVDRFIGLKQTAALFSPEEAADRIVRILHSGRFGQGDVIDARHFDYGNN